jgi:hypothetical protein
MIISNINSYFIRHAVWWDPCFFLLFSIRHWKNYEMNLNWTKLGVEAACYLLPLKIYSSTVGVKFFTKHISSIN